MIIPNIFKKFVKKEKEVKEEKDIDNIMSNIFTEKKEITIICDRAKRILTDIVYSKGKNFSYLEIKGIESDIREIQDRINKICINNKNSIEEFIISINSDINNILNILNSKDEYPDYLYLQKISKRLLDEISNFKKNIEK